MTSTYLLFSFPFLPLLMSHQFIHFPAFRCVFQASKCILKRFCSSVETGAFICLLKYYNKIGVVDCDVQANPQQAQEFVFILKIFGAFHLFTVSIPFSPKCKVYRHQLGCSFQILSLIFYTVGLQRCGCSLLKQKQRKKTITALFSWMDLMVNFVVCFLEVFNMFQLTPT